MLIPLLSGVEAPPLLITVKLDKTAYIEVFKQVGVPMHYKPNCNYYANLCQILCFVEFLIKKLLTGQIIVFCI